MQTCLQVNDMIVVFCDNFQQEPVIGCCSKLNDDTIDIKWYKGSYSTS